MQELSLQFEEALLENEILSLEVKKEISFYEFAMESVFYFEASGQEVVNKIKKAIDTFFEKIKDMIRAAKERITAIVTGEVFKKKTNNIENALKENPKLMNEKVKITDYDKLNKLNESAMQSVMNAKSNDEIERAMKKYKTQRNAILAATAVIGVTAGVAFTKLKNRIKNQGDVINLQSSSMRRYKELVDRLTSELLGAETREAMYRREAKRKNNALKSEIDSLRNKYDDLIYKQMKGLHHLWSDRCKDSIVSVSHSIDVINDIIATR